MKALIRSLLGVQSLRITIDEAERIARQLAADRGWAWSERVTRQETLRGFRFRTNTDMSGRNVEITVRGDTGEVTRAWLVPR